SLAVGLGLTQLFLPPARANPLSRFPALIPRRDALGGGPGGPVHSPCDRAAGMPGPSPGVRAPAAIPAEDRLLRKRVVRDGQDGLRPRPGQEVSVKVLGALEDGALVERDPRLTFVPGYGDVVQALELGVPTMQPGEVAFFLAAFPYGYGRPGREPDVPPEAPLLFEVTLLEVRDGLEQQPLPPAARLRLGAQRRERGNFHFTRGDFPAALRSYRLAGAAEQRVKCFNNWAGEPRLLAQQGRDAEAALVLRRALELDPANEVVHAELSRLVKRRSVRAPPPPQEPPPGPTPPSSGCAAAPSDGAARGRVGAGAARRHGAHGLPPRRDPAPPAAEGAA
uniref:peptidylprolyl isomerase n=1 Tax=Melopsittacus undulatus TaxID=13146 RepID=A0A8V5GZ67_MELUD